MTMVVCEPNRRDRHRGWADGPAWGRRGCRCGRSCRTSGSWSTRSASPVVLLKQKPNGGKRGVRTDTRRYERHASYKPTLRRSSEAPVVTFWKKISSAARPASVMHTISMIWSRVRKNTSLGRYCAKPSAPDPRGTMVTFSSGSACSRFQPVWFVWGESEGVGGEFLCGKEQRKMIHAMTRCFTHRRRRGPPRGRPRCASPRAR
jgi:hypothetical protein